MKFVNLTPHAVRYSTLEGVVTVPASGTVARLRETLSAATEIAGAACCRVVFDGIEGLPGPARDTVFIVSALVIGAPELRGGQTLLRRGLGQRCAQCGTHTVKLIT